MTVRARTNLRAVPPPASRDTRQPGRVSTAAAHNHRDLLVALRDEIAGVIDEGVPARDLASLSLRLVNIADEIAAIDAEESGDDIGLAAATADAAWPSA